MRVLRVTHRVSTSHVGEDHGAIAVIVALLSTVFLVLAAFAVDIGNAYAQGRQVSVAMDAAALAAAAKVGQAYPVGQSCTAGTLATIGAQGIAQTEADRINAENRKDGLPEAVQSVTVTCAAGGNAIQVDVANTRGVDTAFAGIIGIETINPGNYAAARFIRSRASAGLRPWAVCRETIEDARNRSDETFWTAMGNWNSGDATGICGTSAPGQWGGVDFDGGNNAAGDLVEWTRDGYPGSVELPDPALPADPGVSLSQLPDAFRSLVNQVVQFPAVEGISGNGSNAVFDAVGIASVKVCGIVYNGNIYNTTLSGEASDCWRTPIQPTVDTDVETEPLTPPTTTTGTIDRNSTSLVLATDPFALLTTGPGIEYEAVITVTGAGLAGGELVNTITFDTNPAQSVTGPPAGFEVVLPERARTDVTNAAVTIELTRITTTTTTTPGYGLWAETGGSGNLTLADQIQFRWDNYTFGGYTGPGSETTCDLDDTLCVGQSVLWQ